LFDAGVATTVSKIGLPVGFGVGILFANLTPKALPFGDVGRDDSVEFQAKAKLDPHDNDACGRHPEARFPNSDNSGEIAA